MSVRSRHTHLPTLFSLTATLDDLSAVSSCRSQNEGTENWQSVPMRAFISLQITLGKKGETSGFSGSKRESEIRVEFLWRLTTNERVKRPDYSSETNSAERLKGRCFIPRGLSSCSLSLAAERSFPEISAHHTGCNKRHIFQNHNCKRKSRNCG